MFVEFYFKGLAMAAVVEVNKPLEPCRRGHPDNWCDGEGGEILIETLEVGGKDAKFLLDSDFGGDISDAAYNVAIKVR